MGSTRGRSSTPDLFTTALAQEPAGPLPQSSAATTVPIPRHVLPIDLPNAIKQLKDQELDLLLLAVPAEKKRRSKAPSLTIKLLSGLGRELSKRLRGANKTIQQLES